MKTRDAHFDSLIKDFAERNELCIPDAELGVEELIADSALNPEEVIIKKEIIRLALEQLTPIQKEVIFRHFFLRQSLKQIGAVRNRSRAAVWGVKSRALCRLRRPANACLLGRALFH